MLLRDTAELSCILLGTSVYIAILALAAPHPNATGADADLPALNGLGFLYAERGHSGHGAQHAVHARGQRRPLRGLYQCLPATGPLHAPARGRLAPARSDRRRLVP